MEKIAVFPGSFDPFTKGHESVIDQFLPLFDHIIIALGVNSGKKYLFSTTSRVAQIESIYKGNGKISVQTYEGLTIDFCKSKKARYLIRGLRNTTDFEFEKAIAQMNETMSGIQTLFSMTNPVYAGVHATIVREIKRNAGDISGFVTNPELLIIEVQ